MPLGKKQLHLINTRYFVAVVYLYQTSAHLQLSFKDIDFSSNEGMYRYRYVCVYDLIYSRTYLHLYKMIVDSSFALMNHHFIEVSSSWSNREKTFIENKIQAEIFSTKLKKLGLHIWQPILAKSTAHRLGSSFWS